MSTKEIVSNEGVISAFVLNGHTAEDVARAMIESGKQTQPFHIFDMDEANRRIQNFQKMMPRVQICYAIKSNDLEYMLKLVLSKGLGFDCASPGEIKKILDLGANPQSIIYAIPSKMPEEMIYARKVGVKHTTFDGLYELKKIQQYWPDVSLLLRIRVESNSIYKLGKKFGCDFETEARNLLDEAAALGLRVAGVAFHVGSACFSPDSYGVGIRHARALFEHEARAGRRMSLLDIGGGFLSDRTDSIDEVASIINDALQEYFPDNEVQVIAEPGRYLSDSSATLYCNINNIRRIKMENKTVCQIYMNDGIYGTMRFSEPWHRVNILERSSNMNSEEPEDTNIILFGPSGDCEDYVMKSHEIRLPRCTPTDWLVFATQGAYTTNFATNFSCLPIPLIRPVVSFELWKILKTSTVFSPNDFVEDPDISAPLPSTIPPLPTIPQNQIQNISKVVSLKI